MIVRFGFVAMSVLLENASPSRTMTYASFLKLADREAALRRLERITEENLHNALRVLRHAVTHDVRVYRLSSKIIPLTTHEALAGWDPYGSDDVRAAFAKLGAFVTDNGIRASFHPDHFCVLSTPRPEVLASSIRDLHYHTDMLEAMGLDERAKCNIHVGGAYGDKVTSGERFIRQFAAIEGKLRNRITLENDDKTFNVLETLEIAEKSGVPMVLDIHHHAVNDGGIGERTLMDELWPRIVATWSSENGRLRLTGQTGAGDSESEWVLPPKVHASSPKSEKDPRGHADHVEAGTLLRFLRGAAAGCSKLDVMLEAKRKDEALFRLMEGLRDAERSGEGVRILDAASIEVAE
ncbi:UV damage repair endonuclease UvdE [Paenibacillus darwinianus]|uniref:UV damage repair endonuclease UvdE n=1 Tax=Paenibacillus darwinianus TaxID=1380763 RepID=A0A9W5S1R0_9BACL|nr:UV DNA damage repair endonuclease UvsE [Paenibacillus darwinianus]EXX87862.1 UV damage repair endonuclease UvdE [Paenibacillus darwinianus]EXX90539.1 UV damage repair endonuclease UvdE [Paenibacillus darwinianus]EXX90571.1 UV damage repair endonuclease UvdE [Paenibacillus darwinianus]